MRKDQLVNGEFYHIFSRSIAGFEIFHNHFDYNRFILALRFYNNKALPVKFSEFLSLSDENKLKFKEKYLQNIKDQKAQIIACCLMPTHIHLLLKQIKDKGISLLMGDLLNSCTRYFNLTHKRKGPLWESTFKNVLVDSDEQLLHLTRYIHLNPVSAHLVEHPKDWQFSSYDEYVNPKQENRICEFEKYIDMNAKDYEKFVMDRKDYQRELSKIKKHLLEPYFG